MQPSGVCINVFFIKTTCYNPPTCLTRPMTAIFVDFCQETCDMRPYFQNLSSATFVIIDVLLFYCQRWSPSADINKTNSVASCTNTTLTSINVTGIEFDVFNVYNNSQC